MIQPLVTLYHLFVLSSCSEQHIRSESERDSFITDNHQMLNMTMISAILLFAALSTAFGAQIGRRQPYGIYPGPSITASSSSVSIRPRKQVRCLMVYVEQYANFFWWIFGSRNDDQHYLRHSVAY